MGPANIFYCVRPIEPIFERHRNKQQEKKGNSFKAGNPTESGKGSGEIHAAKERMYLAFCNQNCKKLAFNTEAIILDD